METAMKKLINYLDPIHESIRIKAEELLKLEEYQIQNAYTEGFSDGRWNDRADDYYSYTYFN